MSSQIFKVLALFLFFFFFTSLAQAADPLDCLNINTAPKEELKKIKHIGEARAEQIINLREEKLFSSVDDLVRVVGIGPSRLADIKEQGLACVKIEESQPEPQPQPMPEPTENIPPLVESELEPEAAAAPVEVQPPTYSSGIVINEILPSPTGPDTEEEWIEIFNQNNFEVNLSDWQITDAVGKTNIYIFTKGTTIAPKSFLVFSRPTTKIILNNDGDGLNLLQPDGKIVDKVSYEKTPRGESYNRTESGWVLSTTLTPGSANIVPAAKVPQFEPKQEKKSSEVKPPKIEGLATVGERTPGENSNLLVLLIAFIIAVFSGAIILILKKKVKTSYNQNV